MTLIFFEPWVYFALLGCIVLLAIQLIIVAFVLVKIKRFMQLLGVDLGSWAYAHKSLIESQASIHKKMKNARERDVEMLHIMRKQGNHLLETQALVTTAISEVKKGNKDQQEIKTKLTNLRQLNEDILKEAKEKIKMTITEPKSKKKK